MKDSCKEIFLFFFLWRLCFCYFRCDADPQALAKYVLALVKKEKEEQDLKDVCAEQLDVFLQESE